MATTGADDGKYRYNFIDWTNTCGTTLTDDCELIANFEEEQYMCDVTWKNGNTFLDTDSVEC